MTVYDRHYKPWQGQTTPRWRRFLVPTRYSLLDLLGSKLFLNLYAACFIPPLIFGAIIYFHHNNDVMSFFHLEPKQLMAIDDRFYYIFMHWQALGAYLITLLVGPLLLSVDYENNALPLYLVRPFTSADYIISKAFVLVIVLSTTTWLPGILLFALQGYYEDAPWITQQMFLARAILAGFSTLILLLAASSVGLGAMFRTRTGVGLALLALPIVAAVFSFFVRGVTGDAFGRIFHILGLLRTIWRSFFTDGTVNHLGTAWVGLLGLCTLFMVIAVRRIRACEVVS